MRVSASKAKVQLAALLDRAEHGERISITRYGRVVAVLGPPPGGADRTVSEAVDGILSLRQGRMLGEELTIRELIGAGRR